MKIAETERLVLRRLTPDDGQFILELLNDPAWLHFIGDKGVRSLESARDYIRNGPMAMYERYGFGLFLAELKDGAVPIGICGLIKRDALEDVDIGFALLPGFRRKGYAREAASAVLNLGREFFGLKRIVAITASDNVASARLLGRLGLTFERMIRLSPDDAEVRLFGTVG